jgi:F-type H+-transporting ATPase subunit b
MKRTIFLLTVGFFAASVLAAPAVYAAAAEPAEGAGQQDHAAAEADEGEHAIPPINFWDFSNKEQPPYGVMLVNFVLLAGLYYWMGKKPITEGLKARRANVAKEIEEAQKMRAEAEARAVKYQQKLKDLEVELKETRSALQAAGEAERDRIVREAEEKAGRMERDAKFLVEQEMKQMRTELTREAVEMAVTTAEELLRKRITPADQERLAEDYLTGLIGKRPTASLRPPPPSGGE